MTTLVNVGALARRSLAASQNILLWRRLASSANSPQFPPKIPKLDTPEENNQARQWISTFRNSVIPKNDVELTYSRSSGPGGQVSNLLKDHVHVLIVYVLSEREQSEY